MKYLYYTADHVKTLKEFNEVMAKENIPGVPLESFGRAIWCIAKFKSLQTYVCEKCQIAYFKSQLDRTEKFIEVKENDPKFRMETCQNCDKYLLPQKNPFPGK